MEFPKQIQTRTGRAAYRSFKVLYLFQLGKDKVLGRPFTFLPEMAAVYILLKFGGFYDPPKQVLVGAVVCFILASVVCGWLYYRLGLDRVERLVAAERDVLLKELHERLVR